MISSNILLVALTLFRPSISTTSGGPYQSFQEYINDIPYCVNNCWGEIWSYAETACPGGGIKCVCLIPEPDLSDPTLAKQFQQIDNCTAACSAADQNQFADAETKFNGTCQPYYAQYGEPLSASESYYLGVLSAATSTVTATYSTPPSVAATQTGVNNATITSNTGNLTAATAATSTGTPTTTAALEVSNVGVWKNAEWGISIGLPLLVSFALGVGAQFF